LLLRTEYLEFLVQVGIDLLEFVDAPLEVDDLFFSFVAFVVLDFVEVVDEVQIVV